MANISNVINMSFRVDKDPKEQSIKEQQSR